MLIALFYLATEAPGFAISLLSFSPENVGQLRVVTQHDCLFWEEIWPTSAQVGLESRKQKGWPSRPFPLLYPQTGHSRLPGRTSLLSPPGKLLFTLPVQAQLPWESSPRMEGALRNFLLWVLKTMQSLHLQDELPLQSS